ncbi:hypothetical protein PF008_g18300 [Phytophthora fragariae]|uniref:Crinkler effector protein N-terminal domain-containing protein n=1 Tax=Phytophthora fragariae TaxID=53985 RepID=A0A6G0R5R5_9STRA|nr:hypothetical protein PF008_g18300 [Phytophthora fragariae]
MASLSCAIAGVAEDAFSVDIDERLSVGHLKEAIKKEKMFRFPANEMRLFLAKQDGNWMNGEGVVAVKLEKAAGGAVPVLVDGHGNRYDFVKMDPTRWIKNSKYFGANFQPGKGQIHVLVVIDWENLSVENTQERTY